MGNLEVLENNNLQSLEYHEDREKYLDMRGHLSPCNGQRKQEHTTSSMRHIFFTFNWYPTSR